MAASPADGLSHVIGLLEQVSVMTAEGGNVGMAKEGRKRHGVSSPYQRMGSEAVAYRGRTEPFDSQLGELAKSAADGVFVPRVPFSVSEDGTVWVFLHEPLGGFKNLYWDT